MDMLFIYISIIVLIYIIRKDLLALTFTGLFYFLFCIIPAYIIYIDHENTPYAEKSIIYGLIFLAGFFLVYLTFRTRQISKNSLFSQPPNTNILYSIYMPLFFIGVLLKIMGGDLIHSSIYQLPWSFPALYGPADRVYYVGAILGMVSLYINGLTRKNILVILSILAIGLLGGSRVAILLPLSFLFILHISRGNIKSLFKGAFFGFVALVSLVSIIGILRTDDVNLDVENISDVFLFRISEFYWPLALIEKIENGEVVYNPIWIISGLFGIFPSGIGEFFMGTSVFSRDTDFMINIGLGSVYMSVPLTPLGEGFYWFGTLGVLLIGAIYGFGFSCIGRVINGFGATMSLLLLIQMFRFVFALPVAGYPEFISLITKDMAISFVIAAIITPYINKKLPSNNTKSHSGIQ